MHLFVPIHVFERGEKGGKYKSEEVVNESMTGPNRMRLFRTDAKGM